MLTSNRSSTPDHLKNALELLYITYTTQAKVLLYYYYTHYIDIFQDLSDDKGQPAQSSLLELMFANS